MEQKKKKNKEGNKQSEEYKFVLFDPIMDTGFRLILAPIFDHPAKRAFNIFGDPNP